MTTKSKKKCFELFNLNLFDPFMLVLTDVDTDSRAVDLYLAVHHKSNILRHDIESKISG